MQIGSMIWLVFPMLALVVLAALRAILGASMQSKRAKIAGVIVAVAILSVYMYLRYVIFPE